MMKYEKIIEMATSRLIENSGAKTATELYEKLATELGGTVEDVLIGTQLSTMTEQFIMKEIFSKFILPALGIGGITLLWQGHKIRKNKKQIKSNEEMIEELQARIAELENRE